MAKVDIRCPVCRQWDKIDLSDDAVKNISKGLLAINIAPGMICEHSFIAYVDKNLIVRDCLVADFKIELVKSESTEEIGEANKTEAGMLKLDLIRINIPAILMGYIFRTFFLGKKAVIISKDDFLFNQIKNFFKNVLENTFKFDLDIITEIEYNENRNKYEEHLVFKNQEVIRDKQNIINPKGMDIEKSIAKKFFAEYDLTAGLIMLRNEIKKTYEFSQSIVELIEHHKGESLTSKNIIKLYSKKYGEKINANYLRFLLNIAQNYFKVKLTNIDGISNLLEL
jgi:hypothetical protein